MWKENILKDLEAEALEYETVVEFLADIKRKFRGGEKEIDKVVELRRLEQGGKTTEEFV